MTGKGFGSIVLGSLLGVVLFIGTVTYGTHNAVTTTGRTVGGVIAKGFIPTAAPYEDSEQAEDIADAEESALRLRFAEAFGDNK